MMCNAPTVAYRVPGINPATKSHSKPVKFFQNWKDLRLHRSSDAYRFAVIKSQYDSCPEGLEPVLLPCKHCLLCTRAYRRMWAYRLSAEARTCGESMYLTLTVDDEHMQHVFPDRKLVHRPFQLFLKRLRKKLSTGYSYEFVPPRTSVDLVGRLPRTMERRFYKRDRIKYYMCGEYGDLFGRPHYHACIFGARFPDAYFAKKVNGNAYYMSPTLSDLWPYGEMTFFSDVTPSSASYVAGYVDKKIDNQYWRVEHFLETGEWQVDEAPEYVRMSQGIGLDYFNRYNKSLYRLTADGDVFGEFFDVGGVPISAPVYFDEKLRLQSPEKYDKIVASRECRRLSRLAHMTVSDQLNESGRKNAVLLARRKVREVRELTGLPLCDKW